MWHNCWQTLVETSQARKHTHTEFKAAWEARQEQREGFGFILAHLMLQKSTLHNIFMHQWSSERIPNDHLDVFSTQRCFVCLQKVFLTTEKWVLDSDALSTASSHVAEVPSVSLFKDPLWSFHTDYQGFQSRNSPEIKMWGTGGSNHFSTSSLSLISSHCLRRKLFIRYDRYTWDVKDAFRPYSLSPACIAAFYLQRVDRVQPKASNLNCLRQRLSLICSRLHSLRHQHVALCLIRLRRQPSLEPSLNFKCLPGRKNKFLQKRIKYRSKITQFSSFCLFWITAKHITQE